MITDLLTNLENIHSEVMTKLTPENIKKNVTILNVTGAYGTPVEEKDVNFIDYDGTILYSYTASEFTSLTAMPANPIHEGLTAQGWNWSLSDAQNYVASYGKLYIGQMYVTDDNKTRIYIKLVEGRLSLYLGFAINGTATVEWGDGTSEEVTGTSTSTIIYTQHNYTSAGEYIIKLSSESTIYLIGNSSLSKLLSKKSSDDSGENLIYLNAVKKVELGVNINIGDNAFLVCYSLSSITIPNSITSIGNTAFRSCPSLPSITIPNSVTSIGDNAFYSCSSLANVAIPNSITSIGSNAFRSDPSLSSITIPNSVTSIGDYAFYSCYSLLSAIMPNSVTSMGNNTFRNCIALSNITIPNNITSIGSDIFYSCYNLPSVIMPNSVISIGSEAFFYCSGAVYYDFSEHTSIPTLTNTNAFAGISSDGKIIVPDDLYEDWIAATNWSTYADYIIKKTDWEAL